MNDIPPLFAFCLAVTFAAVSPGALPAQTSGATIGIDTGGMERSVAPGDSFFAYANGTWLANTEIPADRSSYGPSAVLAELTDRRVADLIQGAAKAGSPAGSEARKIGDYYASFMDTTAIEAAGLKPLQPTLASIAATWSRYFSRIEAMAADGST